ncbi:putative TIR domain, winged helix-turn-helix DNA-binding domain-containing protein [Rosa chinensis]|uniref:ADP-ribosyl cyclase/cyclic ADP-ribose hydrolase n=1 Tax=Rosa chinensis TaxID=74649 RepID=A0A2P6SMR3_ROSCH|nr:disease resistance protein RUN1 [Rosa chinensis]XP_040367978.1 disease resistance protein RUN1 [Rosa chinensis]XP_040367982.1 disease resistance protein RUN1 [Rosa chinensis]XP_040367984.1 disease resistance protein RUN1 [Rosa chinensis]XP_040367987.1 disease resistance protein RUN1 [Rosa chinensis]XP_040367993.1 disease resistance protein RUN1 [Rosa chinensis]XP_040367997.1 disease resistance protein RUN1 [Rosa chinensis]XP_040368001.1 disease resistance protein RUN1 [Rosa chinensis]XP_
MMASSSSPSGDPCEYDVFLSFRGEDTRKIFAGHLYRALQHKAIRAFIDSEELEKGNNISELLTYIEKSRLSIVVLSRNYAFSTWCLKELVKILDCMDKKKQMVLPIFYDVDPSDLRKIKGKYAEAFAKHGENPNIDKEEVKSWRSSVNRVADLSGWDSTKYEDDGKLIEEIVANTHRKLIQTSSNKDNGLVGMDSHITEMMSRLCLQVNDVRVVGIWGMGGLGKTTIARAVFDEIARQFEHSCFLGNVKEAFKDKREVKKMQQELLFKLLNEKVKSVDLDKDRNVIMERLGRKKVLVVLDDVETVTQIEHLLGKPHAFGEGSRVIVTTRNKQSLSRVDETYHPTILSDEEALELFMKYAFTRNQPNGDYDHLSRHAIEYSKGLPLALKVLGAFLDNKSVPEWEAVLEKLKKIPQIEIQDVLRTSIVGLDDFDRDIFLDIACLFREWNTDFVTELLDSCGFYPRNGLRVLVDRALITLSFDRVNMHDLLQGMGREIVRLESPREPGKRSRLWSYEDVNCVLTQNMATDAVECLVLDLSNSEVDLCINTGAFVRMKKLRLLIIYYSFYTIFDDFEDEDYSDFEDICPVYGCKQLSRGDFEFLSQKLRLLIWHGCPLKSLPSTFIPENLVQLDMRASHIRELWEGIKPLQNLKVIKLSHCQYLVKIPDLTEAIKLERVLLDGCSSLFEVHSSISALENLHFVDLKGCKQLKILPSCIHMKSLRALKLSGCANLEKFPEIADVMMELKELYLDGTAVKELPSSINNLTGLRVLDLTDCTELKTLSTSIHMPYLQTLELGGCSSLEKFPEISGIMKELTVLCLDETAIKGLPSSIDLLEGLEELSMQNCKSLVSLPDSICNLPALKHLDLTGCTELKTLSTSFHMSSLRYLYLDGCSNLEKFPEISGIMKELPELRLDETAIKGLPSSIDHLEGLKVLSMRDCKSLEFLPDSICNLADLTHLDLSGCPVFHNLPEKLGDLKSLQVLNVRDSGIKQLPLSILRLEKLVRDGLSCSGCKEMIARLSAWPSSIEGHCSYSVLLHVDLSDCNLLELSDGIAHLYSLKTLKLCRTNLESLPVAMNRLCCLTHLELEACRRLKSIPELSSSINYIDAHDCTALEKVSMPKPQDKTYHFFTFSNCLQLVQTNLFTDIVERHSHLQDNYLRPLQLNMSLPGSEVPDWFNHQSRGFSVSVQLPPNWFDSKFWGFAICAVRVCQGLIDDTSPLSAACVCTFKGNRGDYINDDTSPQNRSFSFDLLNSGFRTDRFFESDHMFLGYVSWSECRLIEIGKLVNEAYTEATFQIVAYNEFKTEQLRITSCGVRFVYANPDEMLDLNMPPPQVHVDSCETGVCFMDDPYEFTNKETERVEISREIMSSETAEGIDTCHTLQLFPEQQIERKGEKEIMKMTEQEDGEGFRVLSPVCFCFSLSGCTMCSRKRETEREGDRVTRVSEDGELSSQSGLVVPNSETEREEERVEGGFNNGRGVINWKRIARVTMQLLLLAGCSIALKQTTLVRMKGKKSS